MFSILILIFIVLESSFGQTCRNSSIYSRCSINPDCGCLPFSSSNDQSGICAYLHLNASKLRTCSETNYYCDQPYTVCVHHPNLSADRSLCYPTGMASIDLCPPSDPVLTSPSIAVVPAEEICLNVSWSKKGVTVAGSNFTGNRSYELRNPTAILFDIKTNILYVGDGGNFRIVTWALNATHGTAIIGDNGQGNRTDQFGTISDFLMDPKDGSLIICDARNRRIVRWARRAQQGNILIENIYCSDLALDNQGLLYVSEYDTHRVSRWILGKNVTNDGIVAGGNGKGNRMDQLYEPTSIFVDQNRSIYIGDFSNDRIMKWTDGAKEGIIVGKLRWPKKVHLDQSGNMYSIDGYYSRVVRWTPNNVNGTIIIGEQQYTLAQAADLAFDQHGNIYVSNYGTSRIDKFYIDRSACH